MRERLPEEKKHPNPISLFYKTFAGSSQLPFETKRKDTNDLLTVEFAIGEMRLRVDRSGSLRICTYHAAEKKKNVRQ